MFKNFSNIGDRDLGLKLGSGKTAMRGHVPSPLPNYQCKCRLADQDGFAAGLLDSFLRGLRKLVRVNR